MNRFQVEEHLNPSAEGHQISESFPAAANLQTLPNVEERRPESVGTLVGGGGDDGSPAALMT